jgi:hypothetical protein
VDPAIDAILDERLLRMGFLPDHADGPFGSERVLVIGGVPCRLITTSAPTLQPILVELARNGRVGVTSTCIVDQVRLLAVVHGPRATAPAAAMERVVRCLWDRAARSALLEVAHA